LANWNEPESLAMVDLAALVPVFKSFTIAPETTAPLLSLTVPTTVPVVDCAYATMQVEKSASATQTMYLVVRHPKDP
jgi:hypothetical protein